VLDAGYEFHVCNGIYIYHWYRADDPYEHSKKTIESLEKFHYENLKIMIDPFAADKIKNNH
jgi:hypothetical protein